MKITLPLIALLLLTACFDNQKQDNALPSNNNQPKQETTAPLIEVQPKETQETTQETIENQETIAKTDDVFDKGFDIDDYPIMIEKISEQEYHSAFDKLNHKETPKTVVIKDLEHAKTLLQGIVEFDENTESDGIIKSIHFKNGGHIHQPEALFVAYYPDDDILLAEGGHSSDMSFNLTTGQEIEVVGNPNHHSLLSPSGNYRMTSYYGGQECHTHFIQKKVSNEWIKVIEIDDMFNHALMSNGENFLCVLDKAFFADDNTLYAIQYQSYPKEILGYYKITLKSDKTYKTLDLTTIPQKSLPLEVAIDFDNYEQLMPLTKQQAKFFAGLYPNAEQIYLLGVVDYQPTIKSLIVVIKKNRDILSTKLINIDDKGHIIDALEIALTGIREHNWAVTSLLTKDHIQVIDDSLDENTQKNLYKIDNKGYFYLVDNKELTHFDNSDDN